MVKLNSFVYILVYRRVSQNGEYQAGRKLCQVQQVYIYTNFLYSRNKNLS